MGLKRPLTGMISTTNRALLPNISTTYTPVQMNQSYPWRLYTKSGTCGPISQHMVAELDMQQEQSRACQAREDGPRRFRRVYSEFHGCSSQIDVEAEIGVLDAETLERITKLT